MTTGLAHALQQLLQQDAAYTQLLANVESVLAKKLRFRPSATLLQSPVICSFVDALAQLHHLHRMFSERIGTLAAAGANDVDMEERIVDALAEMLGAVRFLYSQLFCRAERVQAALEAADDAASAEILRTFLHSTGLAAATEFVLRPLQHFHALVEFVEALSPLCQDTSLAPRLLQLALDTRQYIHAAQSEARDEQELIALQTQIEPSAALQSVDLSAEKLLLHGEVSVAALRVAADAVGSLQSDTLYAHCFQSGKLIYSRRSASDAIAGVTDLSTDRFSIQGHLELKQDPVFVEPVPDAALGGSDSEVKGALVLISSYESVVLGFEDVGASRQWSEAAASLLSQNEVRSRVVQSQRSFDDIQISLEAAKQLKMTKRRDSLVPFPSFHDDDLPGIFWLERAGRSTSGGPAWELVELMVYDHWLLVSKLVGWKHHALLYHLDCRHAKLSVHEAPSSESEWGLELTAALKEPLRLKLASKRRSRVDFWFDQISKMISKFPQHASAPAEQEPALPVSSVAEPAAAAPPTTRTPKKRRASDRELSSEPASAVKKSSARATKSTVLARGALETIEGGGEGDDALVLDNSNKPKPKRSRPDPARRPEIPVLPAAMKSPAIKTPKRRWLKLKEDDPDDSSLLDTDVSQDTVESSTRLSQSQPMTMSSDVRIILTGIDATPAIRKKIKAISGAVYEDDVERATHVVAPKHQLKRTVKLLCGISQCAHILDETWLDDSARAGAPLGEQAYCLLDVAAQEKWRFDLHKTMYAFTPVQRRQLFAGHTVFITSHKSILPPVKDLVKIVECAGGRAEVKGSAGPSDVVITSETALGVASVQKALASANPQRIYSPELILTSILQQHIDFDRHHLTLPDSSSSKKRR